MVPGSRIGSSENGALDSFYFSITTFLTIGLGDVAPRPKEWITMYVYCVFTFFGLGVTAATLSSLSAPNLNLVADLRSFKIVYRALQRLRGVMPLQAGAGVPPGRASSACKHIALRLCRVAALLPRVSPRMRRAPPARPPCEQRVRPLPRAAHPPPSRRPPAEAARA